MMDHPNHALLQEPSLFKEKVVEEEHHVKGQGKEERGSDSSNDTRRSCTDCKTTKTPLWRSGPAGPKSLCNACGIRYRKKRSSAVGLDDRVSPIKGEEKTHYIIDDSSSGRESLKMRFLVMGKKVILHRPRPSPRPPPSSSYLSSPPVAAKKQRCQRRRKSMMKEEEMAAFSLMALSCGSVFA